MNIIAVVVTYNRMELLKRNIRCLQQNKPISSIVIVNNGSTDGTTEWLAAQEGLTVINQTNVGGAGGFYTGIQYAYQAGADWIWCMDDDVFPRRLQATVTDGNGNPVEGIKVNFRGTSVTLSSTSVETDDQVFAEILVTSTEVGLKTVSASLADKPTEVISRLLNAKVDVNSATITSQEIPEGQVMVAQDIAVKAHVNDQFGNPVTHQPATFSAAPSSQMIISQNTVSTNTQGVAEVTMTPERNGSYTVKASLANGASLEKQLEAIDEKLTLTSSPLIGVNAPKGATLTATLTSANGTPVEGQVINFSVTLEGATLSGGKVRTNSSGQAPVVLTSNKVGTYTVTASFHNGVTIQTQTTVKVTGNSS